jgi:hypothetical protein
MNRDASPWRRLIPAMAAVLMTGAGTPVIAAAPPAGDGDSQVITTSQVPGSTVDQLRQLTDSHQLTELRTTCNGGYGASLLFQADKLSYYVSLFHNKEFWRVIQTDSYDKAEKLYRTFAQQTETLAQVDLDALRLQAGNKYAEHMVELNQQRLQSLQRDVNYQQQQSRQVAALQQQAQQDAMSLTAELHTTSSQLDTVKQQIRELEALQTNPALVLPSPPSKAGPSASAAATPAMVDSPTP